MAIPLPRLGSAVVLRDLNEQAYSSRIESWDGELLTVVKPVGVPAAYPYPPGTPLDVVWTTEAGQQVLPVELDRSRSEKAVLLWELRPVAEAWTEQRREFVRVPAFGRVAVSRGDAALSGFVVDVSEAAMQATLWADPDDALLVGVSEGAAGVSEVDVDFAVRGMPLRRRAVIYGVRPGTQEREQTVVLRFVQGPREATELRREVFAAQVELRKLWRRQS